MKCVVLTASNVDEIAQEASDVLRASGVIIYPTDTLYGLGGDALSDAAFEKVCAVKERDERRPIHAIFSDMKMVGEYAEINETGQKIAHAFLPGPITLIFNKKSHVTGGIARTLGTIGVRIPKNNFCLRLANVFGGPITTTSANASGKETPATIAEIVAQLGECARYVDLAIDGGKLPTNLRSTVVDVRDEPVVLREGVISEEAIRKVLSGD